MTTVSPLASLARNENDTLHVTRRSLLAYRDYRRMLGGQFVSQVADAACTVSVASLVLFNSVESPTVGRLMTTIAATALPLVAAGPLSGYVADRLSRRRILIVGQVARCLISIGILAAWRLGSHDATTLLWALGLCASRVLYTSRVASIRHLVRNHELVAADSMSLTLGAVAGAIGGVLGAGITRYFGDVGLEVVAVAHVVSALLYRNIATNLGGGRDHERAHWRQVARHLIGPKSRYAILATSGHRLLSGCMFACVVLTADHFAGGSPLSYAGAMASTGVGAFLGNTTAEWANERLTRRFLTCLVFGLTSLATVVLVVLNAPYAYLAGLLVVAFLFQNLRVCSDATMQSNAVRGGGGREFAFYDVSYNLSYLVGIIVGLSLVEPLGARVVIAVTGSLFALSGIVFLIIRREDAVIDIAAESTTTITAHLATATATS